MKPLEDALASFVNWLARNFPFLGINSSKPENVWQGINGAIKPAMTEEDLEHSNEKGKEDWYAVRLKNGRVQLFAPDQADAALKAEKDKFISENKDTSDLGNLPVGGSFGPLTVDTTTKAVSTFVSQPSPASDVPADDDVSADVVASVSDQSSALTSTSFKLPMASTTIPGMAIGGSIIGNGALFAHHGEEIDKAQVVSGGKTTLERITDMFRSGGTGGANINVGPTTINLNVDKISSDIDLEKALDKAGSEFDRKLIFRLRNLLDDTGLRGIAYLRG